MAERSRTWRKSPPTLIARFAAATAGNPRLAPRQMFGYPAVFAGGSLCAGLHEDKLVMRLSEVDRAAAARIGAVPWQPTPGRTMREYMALPETIVANPGALKRWLARAIAFTEGKAAEREPAKRKLGARKPGARTRPAAGARKTTMHSGRKHR